jgi:DNA-binding transcriptional ArsR family regulator
MKVSAQRIRSPAMFVSQCLFPTHCGRSRSPTANHVSKIFEISVDSLSGLSIFREWSKCGVEVMQSADAVSALAALANEHRLSLFRLLVRAGDKGLAAGVIAAELGLPNSSLSFHLAHLNQAGLVKQERQGRSLIYSADYPAMNALVGYLMENCCAGSDGCAPEAACSVQPSTQEREEA